MVGEPNLSGFWKRVFAFFVDCVFLTILTFLLLPFFSDFFFNLGGNLWYIGFISVGLYFVPLNSDLGKGQTLGKRLLGIKAVGLDGNYLTLQRSFIRYLPIGFVIFYSGVSSSINSLFGSLFGCIMISAWMAVSLLFTLLSVFVFFGLVFLTAFNKDKRGIHDYLASSAVIGSKSIDDVSLPRFDSFREAFSHQKTAFSILAAFFLLTSLGVVSIFSLAYLNDYFNKMCFLQEDLEENLSFYDVKVQSYVFTEIDYNGSMVQTKSLIICGYLDYPSFNDGDYATNLLNETRQIVFLDFPEVESYDYLKVEIITGYNIGIASEYKAVSDVFSLKE